MAFKTRRISWLAALALVLSSGGGCGDDSGSTKDAQADISTRDTAVSPDTAIARDTAFPDTAPDTGDDGDVTDGDITDGGDTDGTVSDGAVADGGDGGTIADGAAADAASDLLATDAEADASAGPDAPTITEPAEDDYAFGEITVAGTGEADAGLTVRVLRGESVLGSATGSVDGTGNFSLSVGYTGANEADALRVEALLTNDEGSSPPATVNVVHTNKRFLSGSVNQSGGSFEGDTVYVRLYASNADADLTKHVQERNIAATHGQRVTNGAYTFLVDSGSYHLRAFRDSAGPNGTSPDQQPTLQTDAQTPALAVVLGSTHSTGNDLDLIARTNTDDQYGGLDARLINERAAESPPDRSTGNSRELGRGLCGGVYMSLQAMRQGNAANLGMPYSELPDGAVRQLLDDGGCDQAVRDNTSSSYDWSLNDGRFGYGIRKPGEGHAGGYKLFYRQTEDDFLHIEVDTVTPLTELSLLREVTAPLASQINNDRQPTITWLAVAGASAYEVNLSATDGSYHNEGGGGGDPNARIVTTNSYTPSGQINDDRCYYLWIKSYDADPRDGDVDAESNGSTHAFCTDKDAGTASAQPTVNISGSITNSTGTSAPLVVRVSTDEAKHRVGIVRLAAGTTAFSVAVFAGDADDAGQLESFIDAAGTGDHESAENRRRSKELEGLDFTTSNAGMTFAINLGTELLTPAPWATASSTSPAFTWKAYATTRSDAGLAVLSGYSLALWVSTETGGMPETLIGLPPTATSLDLSAVPATPDSLDIVTLFSCLENGGTVGVDGGTGSPVCNGGTGSTPSATTLGGDTPYSWGVVVVSCDWSKFNPSNPTDMAAYLSCVQAVLENSDLFANSENRGLFTP